MDLGMSGVFGPEGHGGVEPGQDVETVSYLTYLDYYRDFFLSKVEQLDKMVTEKAGFKR